MAIFIPEDKLAEIRHTADIVDIISERVVLKKAGKDYVGLCPFHSEKTPSFTVSQTKQIYHCFGCGAGGDVFSFLMKHEGISFAEAVDSLARRYGIDLPTRKMTPAQKTRLSERQRLFDINRQVMEFFQSRLADRTSGQTARAYLKKRGMRPDVIDAFSLGYAPDGWDALIHFLNKKQIPLSLAEKIGLIIPKENNGYYDRFRNRIMFPIFDVTRQVIGFGGRVMDDSKPKYLNSPETPLFNKSRSLYGVHAARDKCRETGMVYIVEGYFDVIALHQHGFCNAVATLGTSLTAEHVRLLKRGFAKKAVLVFDPDPAGIRAAHRAVSLFINEGVDAAVLVLTDGYDPDTYLFEFGAEAFERASAGALPMMTFLTESAIKTHGLSIEGKVRIISEMEEPLACIEDKVTRSIYVRDLSERLNVEESAVMERVQTAAARRKKTASEPFFEKQMASALSSEPMPSDAVRFEKRILSMMLGYPEILPEVEKSGALNYFSDPRLVRMANLILRHAQSGKGDLPELMNRMEEEEDRGIVASLAMNQESWDRKGCLGLLSQFVQSRTRRQDTLVAQIKAAEASHNHDLLVHLLKEKQQRAINRH